MVIPALGKGQYEYLKQQIIGKRLGDGKHKVDFIVWKEGSKRILVSMKWQQVGGTAEQKVPFEMICLINAIQEHTDLYEKAYIVMGGNGWKLRDKYIQGELSRYINGSSLVTLINLEDFIRLVNQGRL